MEITQEQLNKIFELASMDDKVSSCSGVSLADVSEALIKIEQKIHSFSNSAHIDSFKNKKVLIADDLELSIYQLNTLLQKIGITPKIARKKDDAVSEIKRDNFECIIVDLFIPDCSDGLDLVKSAVTKREDTGINSKIIVISGSDDSSLINMCYELGTDLYIHKDGDWHTKLLHYISTSLQSNTNISFSRDTINNSIAIYTLKRFNTTKIFESVVKDVNYTIFSGLVNIIFDLSQISLFDVDNAYVFADIFKLCSENGGKFIIVNPSLKVKEALSFAYLEDIITSCDSIEKAVNLIQN